MGANGIFDMGHTLSHALLLIIAYMVYDLWRLTRPAPQVQRQGPSHIPPSMQVPLPEPMSMS